jgi:hypothetical protein
LHSAADFSQDREGVRIPLDQRLSELHVIAVTNLQLGAVYNRVTFFFASSIVNDRDRSSAVHHHQIARL